MARKKLSEFRAKTILYDVLGATYAGISIDTNGEQWTGGLGLADGRYYVVKVDQGVKGRFKKGLVKLNVPADAVTGEIEALRDKGYRYMLVEPYHHHEAADERYLALTLERLGTRVAWSRRGGVDIEQNTDALEQAVFDLEAAGDIDKALGIQQGTLAGLHEAFEANYLSFLEINPLVVVDGAVNLLDAAAEADEEAASMVQGRWSPDDFRDPRKLLPQEEVVAELADQSQASFRLEVLNPDGAVFLLLSGGGASVVVADEVFNQGHGKELGNYGEYSGNPNEEETYLYASQVISLLLTSRAEHKVLVISGGVANFTDVRVTFRGVIHALDEVREQLRRQGVRVYVRRGGPFEAEGLAMMKEFLEREGLMGYVAGPDLMLAEIVNKALARREKGAKA